MKTDIHIPTLEEVLNETNKLAKQLKKKPLKGIIKYGSKSYDLDEWVTISQYSKIHKVKLNTISNWIARKKFSLNDSVVIPQLNNLVLIKNINFKEVADK